MKNIRTILLILCSGILFSACKNDKQESSIFLKKVEEPITYPIQVVQVNNLLGKGLTLANNGIDELEIANDPPYEFSIKLREGENYEVSIQSQPQNPLQECNVSDSEGIVGTQKVVININCTIIFDNDVYTSADHERGGQLYDSWWTVKNLPIPTDANPIWQYRAKIPGTRLYYNKSSAEQWQCRECHGWDYKGQFGAYSPGSEHYTGINGLDSTSSSFTPEFIFEIIATGSVGLNSGADLEHNFLTPEKLNQQDIYDLTKFISEYARFGQGIYFGGDTSSGRRVYEAADDATRLSCASSSCHEGNISEIESIAIDNPQQFIHKVMFGQPGTSMPAGLSISQARDVLAFVIEGSPGISLNNFNSIIYASQGESDVVKGGLLYDKWWKVTSTATEPTTDHPRWVETNNTRVSGSDTWRCKECHGWDYRGRDGAHKYGTHYTGFAGIINTATASMQMPTADYVYSFLKSNIDHGFANDFFTDDEYYDLTKFVMTMRTEALANISPFNFIDDNTKFVIDADKALGKTLYETDSTPSCLACHGEDGKQIDFDDENISTEPNLFVHDMALNDPWKFVHKIRFGNPATVMQGLYDKSANLKTVQAALDITRYAQHDLVKNLQRAGMLYDKWWVTSRVKNPSIPITRNPIWAEIADAEQDTTVLSNASTWRCQQCHGWDYLGKDGRYSDTTSKHYSGISGFIPDSLLKTKETLIDAIANGNCNGCDPAGHRFSNYLSVEDIDLLADFILAMPSITEYEDALNSVDITLGKVLYESDSPGNCLACHGSNGMSLPGVNISAVAISNLERSLHKYRYGHPGSAMEATSGGFMGLSLSEAGAVLAYAKSMTSVLADKPTYAKASMNRGGRLYDKWWAEMRSEDTTIQAPTGINPFYQDGIDRGSLSTPVAGTEDVSWRCKSCHAWNYKGVSYYPSEPDADNLMYKIELRRTAFGNETDVQNHFFHWIKTGYGVTAHQFGVATDANPTPMSDKDIWDLVKFLLEGGLINTDTYILPSGIVIGTDTENGEGLYNGAVNAGVNCSSCHDADGVTPPTPAQGGSGDPLDISTIAAAGSNPWKFLHKARFGQPNTPMPATTGIPGLTDKDAYDILGYAQQRFNERPSLP